MKIGELFKAVVNSGLPMTAEVEVVVGDVPQCRGPLLHLEEVGVTVLVRDRKLVIRVPDPKGGK